MRYINEFIFIRKDKDKRFSLIKKRRGCKEEVIIEDFVETDNTILEDDLWYYGHYNINKIFTYRKLSNKNN